MKFRYEAVAEQGVRDRGTIDAQDERAALKSLAAQGFTVVALNAERAESAAPRRARRIGATDRALAVRQLAGLIDGGVTLPNALSSVAANSESTSVASELSNVGSAIVSGVSLKEAFARAPKLFPKVEQQVIVAGAESGDLATVLLRLADYFEARDVLRGRLIGGLIALAAFMKSYGVWLLIAIVAGFVFAVWAIRGPLRERALRLLQRLPLVGSLSQSADEVRTLSTLAMLTESAVPLPRALSAAAETARFPMNRRRYFAARDAVERGSSVSQALADTQAIDAMTLELVRQGEAVGAIATSFSKASQLKNQSLERRLQWFATLVEPIMMLILGAIVLVLVLAVMLPIVTLNTTIR
jgi:general secretion pathway protein F